jgi:hypothetical protein
VLDRVASSETAWFYVLMPNAKARPNGGHHVTAPAELRLYTIPETAALMGGVSEMHVYRLIAAGVLDVVDIATPGSRKSKSRVRSDDLADYIKRQTRSARQPA